MGIELLDAGRPDQPGPMSDTCQAAIGVVVPQQQPIFGPRREHPVRFIHAPRDQVIDQNTQVGLAAVKHQRGTICQSQCSVGPSQQPLPGRLLITGGSVELAGKVESLDSTGLQRRIELCGDGEVVLDGIAIPHDLGFLEASYPVNQLVLHVPWQAGRNAVAVDLVCPPTLGLKEDLMSVLLGKPHHLVLNRRTVPGPGRIDLATVHRGAMQIVTDQLMTA